VSDLQPLKDKTTQLLQEAHRTGLLTQEEYTWRAGHLPQASSVGELELLVRDLMDDPASVTSSPQEMSAPMDSKAELVTILGSRQVGAQALGRHAEAVCVLGQMELDYRKFVFTGSQSLNLVAVLGETVLWLPPGVQVRSQAVPILGSVTEDHVAALPGPVLNLNAVIILGSLRIRRG